MWQRIRQGWRDSLHGLDFDTVFVMLTATVLLILFHENCSSSVYRQYLPFIGPESPLFDLYPAFYWFGSSLVVLGLLPLFLGSFVLQRPASSFGIGWGDVRFGLPVVLILYFAFLPILVGVSYSPAFQTKYPLFSEAGQDWTHLIGYELGYAIYFIGWEFLFRGFMLFGLYPRLGRYAVLIQTIPFAILHFGKPQAETLAAVAAGIILGALALRTRSFWYGWLLHTLIAISNDALALIQQGKSL